MTNEELVKLILDAVGTKENVEAATNCATRLRIDVKDDSKISVESLKNIEGVLGVVHDKANYVEVVVGPGKVRKCADICASQGIPASKKVTSTANDWQTNKAAVKSQQKHNKLKDGLKTVGEIFIPLIPGVIAAGLCAGLNALIPQIWPNYAENSVLYIIWNILACVNTAFLSYLVAWAGYRAAEKFGATPILGGMLGMTTSLTYVDNIAKTIGLYNETQPLDSILRVGRGGVLAVIIGVWCLAKIEKWVRSKMPESVDIVFTPLVTMILTLVPYIFIIMPVTGIISTGLCDIVGAVCLSDNVFVRIIAGFLASSLFLPMVAMGMHHGLVALYSVQLAEIGYVTLYPALAMAGAGQVGAALAIYFKAKKCQNTRLQGVIKGAIPAGILGIGEPLIYGVTLPMGKPFITAGLGAGFGGAFVMAMQVGATAWGSSGLLATIMMTAGPHGASSFIYYLIGIVISYVMGFIITNFAIKVEDVAQA